MDEEVVVQNAGRRGQKVGLLMFFLSRGRGPLLIQKIVVGQDAGSRRPGTQLLPIVAPNFPARGKLHLRSLHVDRGSALRFEFRLDKAAITGLINRKCLGSYPVALLKDAEGAGVDVLAIGLLLLFLGQGSRR